jgi:hypothetical protein
MQNVQYLKNGGHTEIWSVNRFRKIHISCNFFVGTTKWSFYLCRGLIVIMGVPLKPVGLNTGCGRKNSPIWEGHSIGWRSRTVVGSASLNSVVHTVFSVHHGVVGRTSSLYSCGVYKKWRVAGINTACISHPLFLIRKRFTVGYRHSVVYLNLCRP